jgi:hypothetical protein
MSKKKKVVPSRSTRAQETPRREVVTSSGNVKETKSSENKSSYTSLRGRVTKVNVPKEALLFEQSHYAWMLLGAGLIALGMLLMSGGAMPDPNTWDPNIIYSTRRTVLAPIVILAGLAVEVYAIFKR